MGFWGWVTVGAAVVGAAIGAAGAVVSAPVALGAAALAGIGAVAGGVVGGAVAHLILPDDISEEEELKKREERILKEKEESEKSNEKALLGVLEGVAKALDNLEGIFKKAERNDIPEDEQQEAYQEFRKGLEDVRITLAALRTADIPPENMPGKDRFSLMLDLLENRANRVSEKFRSSVEAGLTKTTEACLAEYNEANRILVRENRDLKMDLPPELKLRVGIADNRIPEEYKAEIEERKAT